MLQLCHSLAGSSKSKHRHGWLVGCILRSAFGWQPQQVTSSVQRLPHSSLPQVSYSDLLNNASCKGQTCLYVTYYNNYQEHLSALCSGPIDLLQYNC
jgi:hypothetical protein